MPSLPLSRKEMGLQHRSPENPPTPGCQPGCLPGFRETANEAFGKKLRNFPFPPNRFRLYNIQDMIFYRVVFIVAVIVLGGGVQASAFSLGPITVNSQFGERFDAEIELKTETSEPVEISIGSEEDYQKLNLKRQDVVDEVMVVPPVKRQGNKLIIRLSSNKSLFYPSFSLVIRASQGSGTLLESYLITVDFKQSLALKVKDDDKAEPKKPEELKPAVQPPSASAKHVPPPQEAPKPPEVPAPSEVIEEETIGPPEVIAKAPTPLVGQSRARPEAKTGSIQPRRAPAPVMEEARLSHESAVQVAEKPQPLDEKPVATSLQEPSDEPVTPVKISISAKSVWRVENGEGLLIIARSIHPDADQAFRIAVAIWQENQDKFILGNMHGIPAGAELNLERLEERLAGLDLQTAREILWSQWEEWKVIQKAQTAPKEPESLSDKTEEALPGEAERDHAGIFTLLADWKKSWEEEDLARHLSHFTPPTEERKGIVPEHLKAFKTMMFRIHDGVRVGASQAVVFHRKGETGVSFSQTFFSDKMESVGRKDVTLVRDEGEWKILREKFSAQEVLEKSGEASSTTPSPVLQAVTAAASYVIHVSSHIDLPTATRVVNELRRKGLDAYSNPIPIGDLRTIYRVYAGRFYSLDLAREITRQIRRLSIGRFAIPVSAPHTLEVGNYSDEKEALEQIKSLRSQNLSPFLFVTSAEDFSPPRFQVLLGAFSQAGRASRLSEKLTQRGVLFTPIQP